MFSFYVKRIEKNARPYQPPPSDLSKVAGTEPDTYFLDRAKNYGEIIEL